MPLRSFKKHFGKLFTTLLQYGVIILMTIANSKMPIPERISESKILDALLGWIFTQPVYVNFIGAAVLLLINVPKYLLHDEKNDEFIHRYLKQIEEKIFDSNKEIRASLFSDCSWIRAVWSNFYHLFIRDVKFQSGMGFVEKCSELYRASPNLFGWFWRHERYIYLKYRSSKLHGSSRTFFKYSMKDEERCNGIAGFARCRFTHDGSELRIELPDISSIITKLGTDQVCREHENIFRRYSYADIFINKVNGITDVDIGTLNAYLRSSKLYINDMVKAYLKLQRINHLPRYIFAKCIKGDGAVDVLVVDSVVMDVNKLPVDKKLAFTTLMNAFETLI